MEFFVDFCIIGMLAYNIHNKEKKIEAIYWSLLLSAIFGSFWHWKLKMPGGNGKHGSKVLKFDLMSCLRPILWYFRVS